MPEKILPTTGDGDLKIPHRLPILPLRDTVVFPYMALPLTVGRPDTVKLIEEVSAGDKLFGAPAIKTDRKGDPGEEDVYRIGRPAGY